MRFEKGMDVLTAQGEKIGTLSRVVFDAKTRDVTDLVVERGVLAKEEKVIPVGLVDLEQEDHLRLRETNQGVDDFLDYETTHYVPIDNMDAPYEGVPGAYWYPPTGIYAPPASTGMIPDIAPDHVLETESSIPEGRVAISQGAQVFSSDDEHIGDVEEVIADSESNHLTHIVISKGFLLKEHKLVPAHWVDRVTEDKVYLSVAAGLFESLPDYQPD